jgi:hypothetical protein
MFWVFVSKGDPVNKKEMEEGKKLRLEWIEVEQQQ